MSLQALKDPDEVIPYTFNWDDGFLRSSLSPPETISTSVWTVDPSPSPAELKVDSDTKTTTTTTATVSGGVAGRVYYLRNKITTSLGSTSERTRVIRCEHDIGPG